MLDTHAHTAPAVGAGSGAGAQVSVVTSGPTRADTRWSWPRDRVELATAALLGVAAVLTVLVRLVPVLRADFPLNDGGLFYLMTRELQQAHYHLPAYTTYNGAHIPFAYPPVGFYLAGGLSALTGWPLLDVVRVLPAVLSALTVPVFALLAWALLRGPVARVAAVFAFICLPRTFAWFVMGGGLTRAPGFLFALLTIYLTYLFYTRGRWGLAAGATLTGSLALASHLENGQFAAYSCALLFVVYGRQRRGVIGTAAIAVAVAALTAPWWATVVREHGWHPFLSAGQSFGYDKQFFAEFRTLRITNEQGLPVLGVLGLLGLAVSIAAGEFFLPCWVVLVYVISPRNPNTLVVTPFAMLVGVAVERLLVTGFRAVGRTGPGDPRATSVTPLRWRMPRQWATIVLGGTLAALTGYAFLSARAMYRWSEWLAVVRPGERAAMRWVAAATPASSRFIVFNAPVQFWGDDGTADWFPALTGRPSVATAAGYEWVLGRAFPRRVAAWDALHACRHGDVTCIEQWAARERQPFTHVYFTKDSCCPTLLASLRGSRDYAPLYENADAAVFVRLTGPLATRGGPDTAAVPAGQ